MTIAEIIDELLGEIMATRAQHLGDYAPIHATLDYLSIRLEEHGRPFNDNRGWPRLLLLIYREAKGEEGFGWNSDLLENDPWLPCYQCGREVIPLFDELFIGSYIDTARDSSRRHELYRCKECGGQVTEVAVRDEKKPRQNWLPWEHEDFKYDFNLPRK